MTNSLPQPLHWRFLLVLQFKPELQKFIISKKCCKCNPKKDRVNTLRLDFKLTSNAPLICPKPPTSSYGFAISFSSPLLQEETDYHYMEKWLRNVFCCPWTNLKRLSIFLFYIRTKSETLVKFADKKHHPKTFSCKPDRWQTNLDIANWKF